MDGGGEAPGGRVFVTERRVGDEVEILPGVLVKVVSIKGQKVKIAVRTDREVREAEEVEGGGK